MYTKHLPPELPENWIIAENDEANDYIEFHGFDGEFLISIMKDSYENSDEPFHLIMNPLKGMLSRYDFESLDWPEWFAKRKEAVQSALDLMTWINSNYQKFDPVTLGVYVSLGTEDQLPIIEKYFKDNLVINDFLGNRLVFKNVNLLRGSCSYSESAIDLLCHFAKCFNMNPKDLKGGILTNEKFQLLEDLRPDLIKHLKSLSYAHP